MANCPEKRPVDRALTLCRPRRTKSRLTVVLLAISCGSASGANPWVVHENRDGVEFFSEAPVAVDTVMSQLGAVRSELASLFGLRVSAPKPVQIVIFRSSSSYRAYLSSRIPQGVNRRAIYYSDGVRNQIYAVNHGGLLADLRHEYTHALLHEWLPYIPLWIDEGIAEYMEETPGQRARSSRLTGMKTRCRLGWSPSLFNLEAIRSAESMGAAEYRNSWAWVHYLVHGSDRSRQLFQSHLAAIAAGEAAGRFSEWVNDRDAAVLQGIGPYYRRFRIQLGNSRR